MNAQLGGMNQEVTLPKIDKLDKSGLMIVGADVTHPGPASVKFCPSIAGLVATTDDGFARYAGSARLQTNKREVSTHGFKFRGNADSAKYIDDLRGMIKERLRAWAAKNNDKLPTQILFYRDGVSESQFPTVREQELDQIRVACTEVADEKGMSGHRTQVTLVICGKRHHTRFFQHNATPNRFVDFQSNRNLKPGLIVDDGVTIPSCGNFYLQSHKALMGTARSCHYFLVHNDMNLTARQLQDIVSPCSFRNRGG